MPQSTNSHVKESLSLIPESGNIEICDGFDQQIFANLFRPSHASKYQAKIHTNKSEYRETIKEYNNSFTFNDSGVLSSSDISVQVNNTVYKGKNQFGEIKAKFTSKGKCSSNDKTLKIEEPNLFVKAKINNIKWNNKRTVQYGLIQTLELQDISKHEKGIVVEQFHAHLLKKQKECLDGDGKNKPFYYYKSCIKIPPGKIPKKKKLILIDRPMSKTKLQSNYGFLMEKIKKLKGHVYLIMRYKLDNKNQWKYVVLDSFDWYSSFNWLINEANCYTFNCSINGLKSARKLPQYIIDENYKYICNEDQFDYCISYENNYRFRFSIKEYPKSIADKLKSENAKKEFSQQVKNKIIEKKIKLLIILNYNKFYGRTASNYSGLW